MVERHINPPPATPRRNKDNNRLVENFFLFYKRKTESYNQQNLFIGFLQNPNRSNTIRKSVSQHIWYRYHKNESGIMSPSSFTRPSSSFHTYLIIFI